ncbi:hypothetical protein DFH06DRAFT_1149545 [Mycena polygramma]|nr:hypothetical protein DFH06DRAFT_1149545 [Mycena polygramma]
MDAGRPFYHDFEGTDWYPIDADNGSQDQPVDVDWWVYCIETANAPGPAPLTVDQRTALKSLFRCKICLQTFYKPVMPLCMHVFCYDCFLHWLVKGRLECAVCDAAVEVRPIRDNAFEMALSTAISDGIVVKSPFQVGIRVTANDKEYKWQGTPFCTS